MGCSTSTDVRSSRPGDAPDDSAKKRKDLDELIKHKINKLPEHTFGGGSGETDPKGCIQSN